MPQLPGQLVRSVRNLAIAACDRSGCSSQEQCTARGRGALRVDGRRGAAGSRATMVGQEGAEWTRYTRCPRSRGAPGSWKKGAEHGGVGRDGERATRAQAQADGEAQGG